MYEINKLKKLLVKDLKDIAKEKKVKNFEDMKKDVLIENILSAQKSPEV